VSLGPRPRSCRRSLSPLLLPFFFNRPATPELSPLSLHDALPIWLRRHRRARLTEPRFVHGPHQHGAGRTHERTVIMQYTDPPGMPDDERMTPAEFRVVREFLGLTPEWLAAHLGVSGRTVRHWEQG